MRISLKMRKGIIIRNSKWIWDLGFMISDLGYSTIANMITSRK